jgi:hypothetical protein
MLDIVKLCALLKCRLAEKQEIVYSPVLLQKLKVLLMGLFAEAVDAGNTSAAKATAAASTARANDLRMIFLL